MDLVRLLRLDLDLFRALGLDSVPLWEMGACGESWLVLGAREAFFVVSWRCQLGPGSGVGCLDATRSIGALVSPGE
jgi:hypothetical protein